MFGRMKHDTAASVHSHDTTDDLAKPDASINRDATDLANVDTTEQNFQLKSPKFWLLILGVFFSIFLVGLDRIILSTAIAAITDQFNSIEDIGWYGSAFMLTLAIFLPLFGRIYKLYSVKWVFVVSIIVFEVGSALCGAAPSSVAFIIGRAIAGIGSAGVMNGGMNVITTVVPLHKRPAFMALFGIFTALASVLGPLVGGTFTDNASLTWRWCFYINLPIGASTLIVVLLFLNLPPIAHEKRSFYDQSKQLDPLGVLFLAPSMICLILALQYGGGTDSWSAPRVIGLLVTFAVLFVIFIVVEIFLPDTAMFPMSIVLNRNMAGGTWYMFMFSGSFSVLVYYIAIWFQASQGTSAKEAGIRTIPLLMAFVVLGILSGILTQKIGYYVPALIVGSILLSVGAGMLSTMTPTASSSQWIGYQIIFGFGVGAGFQTSMLIPQVAMPKQDVTQAMAAFFFMKELGGAIMFSVGQNIFSTQLIKGLQGVAGLDPHVILNTGAIALRKVVPASEIETVLNAYSFALTRVFVLAAAIGAASILGCLALEWKSVKKAKAAEAEKGAKGDGDVEKAEAATEQKTIA